MFMFSDLKYCSYDILASGDSSSQSHYKVIIPHENYTLGYWSLFILHVTDTPGNFDSQNLLSLHYNLIALKAHLWLGIREL